MNNCFDLRYSPRALSSKKIDEDIIEDIFKTAGTAPSSYNSQPWRFLKIDKSNELYNTVYNSLSDFNKGWAKNASSLIVTFAIKKYEHDGSDYKHATYDLGQSVAYLTIRALEHDIYIRQMGGFDNVLLTKSLNINSNFEVVTILAMGYLGSIKDIDEQYQKIEKLPRTRKPLNEILFNDLSKLK